MNQSDTTRLWTADRITAWEKTRDSIARALGTRHRDSVDDVHQEVFLSASKTIETFDPTIGSFGQWIAGVANNQAATFLKKTYRNYLLGQEAISVSQAPNSYMHTTSADHADAVIAQLDTLVRVSRVLKIIEGTFDERLYRRSIALIRDFDGDYAVAARCMRVTVPALRESHRQMMELAQVIDRALEGHYARVQSGEAGEPVTVREILSCFPDPDAGEIERSWMRAVPLAVMSAGAFAVGRGELVQKVSELTGYAPVSARHVIARCERLCIVARAVLESGDALTEQL